MAYSSTNPAVKVADLGIVNGRALLTYESTHAHAAVSAANFFTDCGQGGRDPIGMKVGDIVMAINQSTAGTSAITWHRVTSLTTSTGWQSQIHATVSAGSS